MAKRGASRDGILRAIAAGNAEPAKEGRTLFRPGIEYSATWAGKMYAVK